MKMKKEKRKNFNGCLNDLSLIYENRSVNNGWLNSGHEKNKKSFNAKGSKREVWWDEELNLRRIKWEKRLDVKIS